MWGALLLSALSPSFSGPLKKASSSVARPPFKSASPITKAKIRPYRVVLDPGHGGFDMSPSSIYGDKFDLISRKYLDRFRPGAYHNGVFEYEETYALARMIQDHLFLTQSKEGQKIFRGILKKYTRKSIKKIQPIEAFLSRANSFPNLYLDIKDDPNAPYRLYDYPDVHTGKMKKGRISVINSFRPQLVVSLHLTTGKKNTVGALNAVITPGFDTFKMALEYAKKPRRRSRVRAKFKKSDYANWFQTRGRDHFQSFLLDAWIYFSGYWCDINALKPIEEKFRGYRHNMVTWRYRDPANWHFRARRHLRWTPYAKNLRYIRLKGAFWQRERSDPESWRREAGFEGYGGDNLYASHELLRYIRKGLLVNHVEKENTLPEILEPYLSTWSVPTYVNAISAYLELGYLDIDADYQRLLKNKKVYAEAIAVGIYSLFFSLKQKKKTLEKHPPRGRAIHFNKYIDHKNGNYFDKVL